MAVPVEAQVMPKGEDMKANEFLREFDESHFPSTLGPVLDMQSHDPPFRKADLRQMAKEGLIVLDETSWTYRLTLAATDAVHNAKVTGSPVLSASPRGLPG
ncbi:MAG: hypothetical protein FD134_725 [Gallionellaceae bacterium]|nr:MAG: hypothetical protein FD134_725 [Gallionellaceae bacterium]